MTPDTSPRGATVTFDAAGYVRRARRLADLSQRDLAERLDVAQGLVARVETGGSVSVSLFARTLALADLRMIVVDGNGDVVDAMPAEGFRSRAGSRLPAHLDVHAAPERFTTKQLLRAADPAPRSVWYHRRADRDALRRASDTGPGTEQLTPGAAARRRRG